MKHFIPVLALLFATSVFGQSNKQVQWNFSSKKLSENTYEIHMTATVNGDWHLYAQNVGVDGPVPTSFSFTKNPLLVLDNKVKEEGNIVEHANPNGASRNIAGISNTNGNVFGMMPHPERACCEALGNTDGRDILQSLLMKPDKILSFS